MPTDRIQFDRTGRQFSGVAAAIATSAKMLLGAALLATLSACSSGGPSLPSLASLNPFKEEEVKLPGKRIAVLKQTDIGASDLGAASRPATLPPPIANASWSQPGGVPTNAPGHLALQTALQTAWRADAGTGSSSDGKLTASPIVFEGRIYTLDAEANVTAFSAAGGSRIWRVSLVPQNEDEEEGFGGGLAADSGRVFVATGFGTVVALNPASGAKLWERPLGSAIRASPTAANGRVFITTVDGRFFALSAENGTELWTFRGIPQRGGLLGNASPAVSGETVVVPFPSGDVVAIRIENGEAYWSESLTRTRSRSAMASLTDASRPVIDRGTVFAVGHSGRLIATDVKTGERKWSKNIRSNQTPWVAGEGVYVVDATGRLIAMTRSSGEVLWITKLPESTTWSGPVLAGSRLWLTSARGKLVSVDAATGKVTSKRDLGQQVYIAPVVAGGRMYIFTDEARLIALR